MTKDKASSAGKHDIAIIGMALRTSLADNYLQFWQNLVTGRDCIRPMPDPRLEDTDNIYSHVFRLKPTPVDKRKEDTRKRYTEAGYLERIDTFDYRFFRMSPREASLMDPAQRLFLETAYETFDDAGYGGENISRYVTGVYVGYSDDVKINYFQLVAQADPASLGVAVTGNLSSIVAGRVSYFLDLKGPNIMVDTACSSALTALCLACRGIQSGDCQQALVGGVRLNLLPVALKSGIGIDSSDGRTKTFDDDSDGTGSGEGAAAILIKPLRLALKDRDHIYAVIKGSAMNQDGRSLGITAPNSDAQADVMLKAWNNAGVSPDSISFVETHGVGTRLGDPVEIGGLIKAFSQYTNRKQFCALGSVKTNIGHLFEAAGIFGVIKAALCLRYRLLPPILHFNRPHRDIPFMNSPFYINDELTPWENDSGPLRCGVTAFGFSGTNCHVVMQEPPLPPETKNRKTKNHALLLSARTPQALEMLIELYYHFLLLNPSISITDLCYTTATGRRHFEHRLAVRANDIPELRGILKRLLEAKDDITVPRIPHVSYGFVSPGMIPRPCAGGKLDFLLERSIQGDDVDWEQYYARFRPRRVSLPSYPFQRLRCWVSLPSDEETAPANPLEGKLFFDMEWVPAPLHSETTQRWEPNPTGSVLIILDQTNMGRQLAEAFRTESLRVFTATLNSEYGRTGDWDYKVNGSQEHFDRLFYDLGTEAPFMVIFMASLDRREPVDTLKQLELTQQAGVYQLFHLARMMLKHYSTDKTRLLVISSYAHAVTGREKEIKPENAPLFGLTYAIDRECENLSARCVDVDDLITPELLLAECKTLWPHRLAVYREGVRYTELFAPKDLEKLPHEPMPLRDEGVYLITGGTGGIGLEFAKYLAGQRRGLHIALLNRSPLPPEEQWDAFLEMGEDKRTCRKIEAIREIEALGAEVVYYQADCSSLPRMKEVFEDLKNRFGVIHGVVHSAGKEGEGLLARKEEEKFTSVLKPKISGAWIIDRLTRETPLDFLVLFSSVATFMMSPGQTDYTAANAYLDALSSQRNRLGLRTLAVNWVTWKETGMAVNFNANFDTIFKAIPTQQALAAFHDAFQRRMDRVLIGELNLYSRLITMLKNVPFLLDASMRPITDAPDAPLKPHGAEEPRKKTGRFKLTGRESGNYSKAELLVAKVWSEVLGFEELSIDDNFYTLGGDSILATQVVNRINNEHNLKISLIEIFNYETVKELAEYFDSLM